MNKHIVGIITSTILSIGFASFVYAEDHESQSLEQKKSSFGEHGKHGHKGGEPQNNGERPMPPVDENGNPLPPPSDNGIRGSHSNSHDDNDDEHQSPQPQLEQQ